MAGLTGFTREAAGNAEPAALLRTMRTLLTHFVEQRQDSLWSDENVWATRVFTRASPAQPVHGGETVYVWLDGVIYNRAEVAARYDAREAESDADLLARLHGRDAGFGWLRAIDGFYAAVVYDAAQGQIHLISDRYGMRLLYWTVHLGGLWWSSELKTALALPGFQPVIDQRFANDFAAVGCAFEDRSWFQGVELVPAGTVLTWNLTTRRPGRRRYWWWDEIRLTTGAIDPVEAADEAARLFIEAVDRQCPEARVNVELSGGLDSRAILAAIPAGKEIHAYTSGQRECDDIRIARRVAALRGATHHVYEIDGQNWLTETTLADLWHLDGQTSLMQLVGARAHGPHLLTPVARLNGIGGDVILRGHHLRNRELLDRPYTEEAFIKHYEYSGFRFDTDYSGLNKVDFFFLRNGVRRFSGGTVRATLEYGEVRMPYLANALVEFVYTLPDELRYNGALYRLMLLRHFPDYFERIPWQKTGIPIKAPTPLEWVRGLPAKTRRVFWKYARRVGLTAYKNNNPRYSLLNRPLWLRQEPVRSFAEHLLTNPDAIYPAYLSRDQVLNHWERHQRGEDFANRLCHYLTAEIWFQQVFTGKYRPTSVPDTAADDQA